MRFKKIIMLFMILNIFSYSIIAPAKVDAAYSKAMTITAKKVAKELAENAAVEMANHILFEMQMNEFLNSDKVDDGYKAVCLNGTAVQCPDNKKAQIKDGLTNAEKKNLSNKVEQVIEKKTLTSNKWGKFMDWFIPIFIIGGLVAYFQTLIDDDSESLLDEIAMEALKDAGYIKPLGDSSVEQPIEYDLASVISDIDFKVEGNSSGGNFVLQGKVKPNKAVTVDFGTLEGAKSYEFKSGESFYLTTYVNYLYWKENWGSNDYYPAVYTSSFGYFDGKIKNFDIEPFYLYKEKEIKFRDSTLANQRSREWASSDLMPMFNGLSDNHLANAYLSTFGPSVGLSLSVETIAPPVTPELDTSGIKGVEKMKDATGNVTVPGIESFTYTDKTGNKIYPSPDSKTGWKEVNTKEDIVIDDEDEIQVEQIANPIKDEIIDEEDKEEFPSCKKNLNKIKFNKVGAAFTNAFPFSIPWDIKRFIDASFGGIDGKKPSFKMPDSLGGAVLEIPSYFDSWISFGKTLVVIAFDISLIYMFYRLMRGGGD